MRHLSTQEDLRIKIGEAVTTTAPAWTCTAYQRTDGVSLVAIPVTRVGTLPDTNYAISVAPYDGGTQDVDELVVGNLDTVSHTIVLQKTLNGVQQWISPAITVAAGAMLMITKSGLTVTE